MQLDRVFTWTRMKKQIAIATDVQDLRTVYDQMVVIAKRWQQRGMHVAEIFAAVNRWHDLLMQRAIKLALVELELGGFGVPPAPYCWLLLGSGGRHELTLYPDQDSALVYLGTSERQKVEQTYFQKLSELVVNNLQAIGYSYCTGYVMATNPRWNLSLTEWEQKIDWYLAFPNWDNARFLTFLADMRALYGDPELADRLQDYYVERLQHSAFLHWQVAGHNLDRPIGIDFFHAFRMERSGEHEGAVNIKEGGYLQLVNATRLYALANGIRVTSTRERINQLQASKIWPEPFGDEVRQALQVFCQHRLWGNHVHPDRLTQHEIDALKKAMKTTKQLQKRAAKHFGRPKCNGE